MIPGPELFELLPVTGGVSEAVVAPLSKIAPVGTLPNLGKSK
jgi:hypothetical protein